MKLYASLTSPYARKIRIALAEKNLPFELVVDSPWESTSRVPSINPLGKVPALETDDGEIFFDSPVIASYIETLNAEPRLIPVDALEAVRVRQLEALADGIVDAAITAFLETRRDEAQRSQATLDRQLEKVERGLERLDTIANGRSNWLHGDGMSIADISVAVMLAYLDLRLPQIEWRDRHAALAAFAERMFERPSFRDTVPPAG